MGHCLGNMRLVNFDAYRKYLSCSSILHLSAFNLKFNEFLIRIWAALLLQLDFMLINCVRYYLRIFDFCQRRVSCLAFNYGQHTRLCRCMCVCVCALQFRLIAKWIFSSCKQALHVCAVCVLAKVKPFSIKQQQHIMLAVIKRLHCCCFCWLFYGCI